MTKGSRRYGLRGLRLGVLFCLGVLLWSLGTWQRAWGEQFTEVPLKASLQLTTEELDYRRANPVLRVHGEENWPPYNFMEEWELKGLSNEYLRLLAKQAGFQLEFVPGSWDQSMQRLAEGEIDVISNMKITPDRQKQFLFSAQPVFEVQTALLARSDQGEVTRLEQLEGKTLAVVRGYFHEELLRKHYPNIQLLLTANTLDAMRQVDEGRADAAIETHAVFNYYIQRYFLRDLVSRPLLNNPIFAASPQYLGIRRDRPILKGILDKAMASVPADQKEALTQRWTSVAWMSQVEFTAEELNYLKTKVQLNLCADPNWYPLDAIQGGKHVGMSADFFELLKQQIPIPIKLVATETWTESLEAMESRRCDVLALVTSGEKTDRDRYMSVTQPYLKIPLVLVTRQQEPFIADVNRLTGVQLGIVENYLFRDILQKQNPQLQIVDVDSVDDGLEKVKRGQLFGFIDLLSTVTYAIQTDYPSLKVAGRFDNTWNLGVGVRNDEPELLDIFEKAIAAIDTDTYRDFLGRWIMLDYKTVVSYVMVWRVLFAAIALTLILLYRQHMLATYNRKLEKIAITDPLTGCFNRLKMEEILEAQIRFYQQTSQPFSIILCDIDHFKSINDRYGHLQGDKVLAGLVQIFQKHLRPIDLLGRWGGEEFLIVCPQTSLVTACDLAEKLRLNLMHYSFGEIGFQTASFGVAEYHPGCGSQTQLVHWADQSLYQAKGQGRNCVVALSPHFTKKGYESGDHSSEKI